MRKTLLATLLFCCFYSSATTAAEPMKIVYYDNYPPRSWLENGEMKGILVDIVDEALGKRLGLPLLHEGYPWARAQALVEAGLADAFITVPTEQRRAYTEVSHEPVLQFKLFIATAKNNPRRPELEQITSIEELKPYSMVEYYGNGFAKKQLHEHNVEWLPELAATYPFLAAGKADVLLVSERSIYELARLGYQEQIVVLPQALYQLSFHLCIGKQSPYVKRLPEIDSVLQQLTAEGWSQRISQSYYQ